MSDLFQDYVVKSVKADSDTCWIKKKEGINKFPVLLQLHRYFDYGLKKHTTKFRSFVKVKKRHIRGTDADLVQINKHFFVWNDFFFNWATKRGSGRAGRETEGPTYTHSCPVPGHRSMEGTKRRQMQTTFFLPKRLQISPPVHLRLAWGVSGACCVPWDQCGGPCSLRSPWFLFWPETPTFSPLSPLEKKTKQKKTARR